MLENGVLKTDSSPHSVQHPCASTAFSTLFTFLRSKNAKTFRLHPSLVDHSSQAVAHKTDSSANRNLLHFYD